MYNKKWNISILVIFILLASSLLGVLAMNFVQSMMKQSATVYNYYQSYYLAKAWVELSLAELGHRGLGFEQTFSDPSFLSGNFLCAGRCSFSFGLSWTSTNLSQQFRTNETCQSPFVLSGGASLIIPLFKDKWVASLDEWFTLPIGYQNLYGALASATVETQSLDPVTFGIVVLSGEELAGNGIFFQTGILKEWPRLFLDSFGAYFWNLSSITNLSNENILPYRFYFLISNHASDQISFCLSAQQPLPTQQYYIKSQWVYDHQTLWLEAISKQPIPDFLINGYLDF